MRLLASFGPSASPTADEIRRRALCTAVMLRQCSFRAPFNSEERRACRCSECGFEFLAEDLRQMNAHLHHTHGLGGGKPR